MTDARPLFGETSYPFAVGRVKALEGTLLNASQWGRLLEAEEAQALSIALSRETMRAIRAHVDGFYLITPFGRVEIIAALLATAGEMR